MKLKLILIFMLAFFFANINVEAQTFALNAQTSWNANDRTAGGKINLNTTGLSCLPDGMQLFSSSDSTFLAGTGITKAMRSITHQNAGCTSCGGSIRDEGAFPFSSDSATKYRYYSIEYYPRKYTTQPVSNSNCLVQQFKTSTDNYPSWALWMEPNGGTVKWSLHKVVDSLNTNNGSATQMVFYFTAVDWNQWAKFTVDVNWSHTSAGYFKLYKDDVLIFTWNGATMNLPYNLSQIGYDADRNGIYDFGLCPFSSSDNTTQRELYMRNWKVGTSANTTLNDFITPAPTGGKFYISAAGSDAANGLTEATAWQSIAKLNSSWASIDPGDSVLFRAGDTFYGSIIVGKSGTSGNPIYIGSYGTGAKPIISGWTTLSSWTNAGGGIYTASVNAKYTLLNVLYDGEQVRMGRYPNFNTTDGGFLKYESYTSNTAITDNELTNTPNWTGAEAVIRKYRWVIERDTISNHTNSVITYGNLRPTTINGATSSRYTPTGVYGYFIQRDLKTLDAESEWYFADGTNTFSMYFGSELPSNHSVKVSTIDTLINVGTRDYITIKSLDLEGAGQTGIFAKDATTNAYTVIDSCTINNIGAIGIQMQNQGNVTITNNTVTNCLSTGIQNYSPSYPGFLCQYNTVTDIFKFQGMGDYGNDGSTMRGITFKVDNSNVSFNTVRRIGYSGITFNGDNVLVEKNVVDSATRMMDDMGGIYTYVGTQGNYNDPDEWNYNRVVQYNLISNSTGNDWGTPSTGIMFGSGIYLDGKSNGVDIIGNVIMNMPRGGITMNNPQNVSIRGNIFYNDSFGVRCATYKWGTVSNFRVTNNFFMPTRPGQHYFNFSTDSTKGTVAGELINSMYIDSNFYSPLNTTPFRLEIPTAQPLRNFVSWKALTNNAFDSKSVISYLPSQYKVNSTAGSNLVTGGQNGAFNTSTASWTVASLTQTWDNTNQIAGGSMKVTFSVTSPNTYGYVTTNIGAVTSSKKYVVRFTLKGTTTNGIVRVYFRHLSPLSDLTTKVYRTFGTSVQSFEVPLTSVVTDASANLIIEFDRSSGTVYVDNVSVYDANITTTDIFATKVRLDTNATALTKYFSVGENFISMDKKTYPGTITVPAYTGVLTMSSPLVTLSSYTVLNSLNFPLKLTKISTGISVNPYSKAYNLVFKVYNESNVLQSTTTNNNVSTIFNYTTPTNSVGAISYLTIEATRVSTGVKYTASVKLVY